MKTIIVNILLIAVLTGCQACEDEPELPPITTEGKNTFGCKINGAVFVPKGGGLTGGNKWASVEYESDTANLRIYGINYRSNESIWLAIFDTIDFDDITKEYSLTNSRFDVYYDKYRDCDNCSCTYGQIESGFLRLIKYDKQNGIVSGTFEFNATSSQPNCTGRVKITDGRFDLVLE